MKFELALELYLWLRSLSSDLLLWYIDNGVPHIGPDLLKLAYRIMQIFC